jgi:CubicO group peptidase (beta-lactamase class C family)
MHGRGEEEVRRRRRAAVAATLALALAACSSGGDGGADGAAPRGAGADRDAPAAPDDDARYPGDEWDRVDAADAGFDPAALDQLGAAAEAGGSSCLVVTRDGAVVDERYFGAGAADVPAEAFSVTKSITSTLVGIAQDEGDVDITDPAATYIPQWDGTPSAEVTVQEVLSNDSGRQWSLGLDYVELLRAPDKNAFGIGLGQDVPPGRTWAYNNSAIQTLSAVLEAATGESPAEFAERTLFEPIGMRDSEMSTDAAGNTITFMGLQTTCLDLARFGYLMLQGGTWDGEQVVSGDYVEQATAVSSTDLNAGYGYLFWLNHRGPVASPVVATSGVGDNAIADGQILPGAPEDVFWALGFNDQVVAVIPSEGIVAVRMGARPPAEAPFGRGELTTGVLSAVVAESQSGS